MRLALNSETRLPLLKCCVPLSSTFVSFWFVFDRVRDMDLVSQFSRLISFLSDFVPVPSCLWYYSTVGNFRSDITVPPTMLFLLSFAFVAYKFYYFSHLLIVWLGFWWRWHLQIAFVNSHLYNINSVSPATWKVIKVSSVFNFFFVALSCHCGDLTPP